MFICVIFFKWRICVLWISGILSQFDRLLNQISFFLLGRWHTQRILPNRRTLNDITDTALCRFGTTFFSHKKTLCRCVFGILWIHCNKCRLGRRKNCASCVRSRINQCNQVLPQHKNRSCSLKNTMCRVGVLYH